MAVEKHNQGHDKVCAEATGHTCICECRGRMHGMRATGGHGSKLRRMGEVTVTARSSSGKADTAAERRRNPVTVGGTDKGPTVQDLSPGKGPGATIGREEAFRQMHGDAAGDRKFGPRTVEKGPATKNQAAADVAEVKPPEHATPTPKPAPSSNEPLWKDRNGTPVRNPRQADITSGAVTRDRQRESERAARNAKPGDAVETDLFGTSTIMGGATSSNDKPKPKTVDRSQQLGMFADESKELTGQTSLTSAISPDLLPDAYDRPKTPSQGAAVLDRPVVPADLSRLDDAALGDLVANTPDGPDLDRVLGELDARDGREKYRQLADSVPDAEGLAGMSEEDVTAMFIDLTSVNHDPDGPAVARVEADLERRGAEQRQQDEDDRALRAYVDEVVAKADNEDDLEKAAEYARLLGDDDRVIAVFEAWDAKEKREQAQLDEQHKAREKAEAERLHAEQEAKRAEIARVAAAEAEREKLDAEFRALSRSELARAYVAHAASMDPERQARHAAAKREMDRRAPEWEADDKRAKAAERRRLMMSGPVEQLTDDELRDAIADIEGDGFNSNTTRQNRLGLLREHKAKRDQEAARVANLRATAPTGPARLRNPIGAVADLKRWAEHDNGVRQRLERARMAALGVPEPAKDTPDEWRWYREREKRVKASLTQAAKDDPRSAQEQAATIIAQYRHLAKIDNPTADTPYALERQLGPADEPNAPPLREAAPFEKIPKAYEQFQDIRKQAMQDRANGDNSTAIRVEKAYRRALGLPDDGTDDEIRSAYGGDERSSGDLASQMLVEFRAQAIADGVDPDDRLRYGPKEKKPKASTSPGYRVKPTPAQEAEVDRRVSNGEDYIEAYADVYGLDPDAMRRQQGPKLTAPQVKAAYEEHVHLQYLDAETATRGHLLSAKGKAKGVDPTTLFSGSLTAARPYASEELLRYWAENERLSFADFKANLSGNVAAIKARAGRSNGRDFV